MDREADSPGAEFEVALAGPAVTAGDRRPADRRRHRRGRRRHEFWRRGAGRVHLRRLRGAGDGRLAGDDQRPGPGLQPAAGLPDGRRPGRPGDRLVADRRPQRGDPLRRRPRPRLRLRSSSPAASTWSLTGDLFSGVWLALIGMVINGSARGAAMQTAITSRIGERPGRRRDGPRTGRDPRRPQRRAGPRRVLPALPLALVPGRRRRPPLPRPARTRRAPTRSPRSPAPAPRVADIVDADRGLFIRDDTPLDSLLSNQNLRRLGALMAVDAEGRLSGVITVEQVGRALRDAPGGTGRGFT